MNQMSETGFLRLSQIIGSKKQNVPPIIPVSASTWWEGVRSGRYPKPSKLSERVTVWRVEDVRALIEKFARAQS
jgi:predicted DNA-binding transcriptional regulator AlpA